MKKILSVFILAVLGFVLVMNCNKMLDYETDCTSTITFNIHYPDTVATLTCSYPTTETAYYTVDSDWGTNYILIYERRQLPTRTHNVIETTAPLEVVDFVTVKNE